MSLHFYDVPPKGDTCDLINQSGWLFWGRPVARLAVPRYAICYHNIGILVHRNIGYEMAKTETRNDTKIRHDRNTNNSKEMIHNYI